MAAQLTLQRLHKLIWLLIYGGVVTPVLGIAPPPTPAGLGGGPPAGGGGGGAGGGGGGGAGPPGAPRGERGGPRARAPPRQGHLPEGSE